MTPSPPPLPPEREQGGILSDEQLAGIREREAKATPGEWRWRWPVGGGGPHLVNPIHGLLLVMDAVRNGLNGATLRFAVRSDNMGGIMHRAQAFLSDCGPRRPDYQEPDNPDMAFIAHSREDVRLLLAHATALARQLQEQREVLEEVAGGDCVKTTVWNKLACGHCLYCKARKVLLAAPAAGEGVGRGE